MKSMWHNGLKRTSQHKPVRVGGQCTYTQKVGGRQEANNGRQRRDGKHEMGTGLYSCTFIYHIISSSFCLHPFSHSVSHPTRCCNTHKYTITHTLSTNGLSLSLSLSVRSSNTTTTTTTTTNNNNNCNSGVRYDSISQPSHRIINTHTWCCCCRSHLHHHHLSVGLSLSHPCRLHTDYTPTNKHALSLKRSTKDDAQNETHQPSQDSPSPTQGQQYHHGPQSSAEYSSHGTE